MPSLPDSPSAGLNSSGFTAARSSGHLFWVLMTRSVVLGLADDFVQFAFFSWTGSHCQVIMSAAGMVLYLTTYRLLKRRRNNLAVALIWTEVCLHATLGTALAGWPSGFHYYLLMMAPTIIIAAPRQRAPWMLAILWCFYLGLFFIMQRVPPLEPLRPNVLALAEALNASTLFGIVTYFTFMYRGIAGHTAQKLKLLATTDPLTGLFNRRYANEMIAREAKHVERGGRPLSFILADIDHFKSVNDRYGHDGGDKVLIAVSRALAGITRAENILSRWGGEEFLFVLPATSRQGAARLAERIHRIMQEHSTRIGEVEIQVTMTIGISSLEPGESWGMALARADQALYEGKRAGRNCVRLDQALPLDTADETEPQAYAGCSAAA